MQVFLRQRYIANKPDDSEDKEETEGNSTDNPSSNTEAEVRAPQYSIVSSYITMMYLKDTEYNDGKAVNLILEDGRFELETK